MITIYYFSFIIFLFVYLIFQTDRNVVQYFLIKLDHLKLVIDERIFMWITLHPQNPIANYFFELKYKKMEKKLNENKNT